MALTDDDRDAIRAITTSYARACEQIRADQDLSAAGKQRAIARAWTAAKAGMTAIDQQAVSRAGQGARDARHRLAGPRSAAPDDMIAWRDAMDRAAQCQTADDARQLMTRSLAYGDPQRAVAVAMMAFDRAAAEPRRGWDGVVGDFLSEVPDREPDIRELARALDAIGPQERATDGMWTRLPRPPELASVLNPAALAAERIDDPAAGDAA